MHNGKALPILGQGLYVLSCILPSLEWHLAVLPGAGLCLR